MLEEPAGEIFSNYIHMKRSVTVSSLSEFLKKISYIKIDDVLKLELVRYM